MFSFVKTVKRPTCKAFIEFTFRHIPLIFSVYLLKSKLNSIVGVANAHQTPLLWAMPTLRIYQI